MLGERASLSSQETPRPPLIEPSNRHSITGLPEALLPIPTYHEDGKHIKNVLVKMYRAHQMLLLFYIPLVIMVMCLTCTWAYIQGGALKYDNIENQWQTCYLQANLVTVPLQSKLDQVAKKIQGNVTQKVTDMWLCELITVTSHQACNESLNCFDQMFNTCKPKPVDLVIPAQDINLPVGNILEAMAYTGFQTVLFSLAVHGALNRSLSHPSWLPAAIVFMVWAIYATLTYYTINPILPIPAKSNATLLVMMMYMKKHIFKDINDGDNNCMEAFTYGWMFLTSVLLVVFTQIGCLLIASYAEFRRTHTANRKNYESLSGITPPLIAAGIVGFFYLLLCAAKIFSSYNMLNCIHGFDLTKEEAAAQGKMTWFDENFFPFQAGTFDLNSILFVVTCMSIVRGYSRQSISAFRLATASSFAFALTAYPGITGAYRFYDYNGFDDYDTCRDFFLSPTNAGTFGWPSEQQAENYCVAFRLSLASATGIIIAMHIIMILCALTAKVNEHRMSMVHEDRVSGLNKKLVLDDPSASYNSSPLF